MEKICNPKTVNYFVWTPLGSRVFPLFNYLPSMDTGGIFTAGVVDTCGNLPSISMTSVANLPPVLTTTAVLVAKFAAGVVDTGGKLQSVLLIPVVNLVLRISANFL
jgi:hypothetical protein